MNKNCIQNCNNWYVLCVRTGKENHIKEVIERYLAGSVNLCIFYREVINKRNGEIVKLKDILFSGYIFVQEKIIDCLDVVKKYLKDEFIHPISVNNKPCKVDDKEMGLLFQNSNADGLFMLSKAYKKGDTIEIIEGPLKELTGNILWINEKKKKARVRIFLFNKQMEVNLGLDFITNRQFSIN